MIPSKLWEARLHPDDLESVREHVRQSNSGEIDHFSFEYRERRVDGRWIWILARGRSVEWDENGRPTRLIGTDIDITKLKDEEARRAAEAELAYQRHLAELEKANQATEAARQAADALARLDPLSNLANRRGFAEEIERLSADAGAPAFAVLLIDLDRFKPVNDMHGHAVGDLVIKESAQRLAAAVGRRWHGGEARRRRVRRHADRPRGGHGGDGRGMRRPADRRTEPADFGRWLRGRDRRQRRPRRLSRATAAMPDMLFRYADMALYQAKQTRAARGRLIPRRWEKLPN